MELKKNKNKYALYLSEDEAKILGPSIEDYACNLLEEIKREQNKIPKEQEGRLEARYLSLKRRDYDFLNEVYSKFIEEGLA